MHIATRWWVAVFTAGCLGGCASAAPQPQREPAAPPGLQTPVAPAAQPRASAPTEPPDAPASGRNPSGPPVLAADSLPPGLTPLTDAEAEEAESRCAGLSKALAEAVRKDKSGRGRADVILDALQRGVSAPGVDVPRCTDLIRRDLLIYRARMIESEAISNIKMISLGLSTASTGSPPTVCPSAGPTPSDLSGLQNGPVAVPADAWSSPGWTCVRFQSQVPLRFQYELRTDPSAKTYEIIARGYPVAGQPPVELFQQGRAENGAFRPSSQVLRRP